MKKIEYLLGLLIVLVMMASCSNEEYEFDNLFPEEYHKILLVKNEGMHKMMLYNTEEDSIYTFPVCKAGSHPQFTATAKVSLLSEEVVKEEYSDREGVNYKILPPEAYKFENGVLNFQPSEAYKSIRVALHPSKVKEALESDGTASWILPFELTSEDTPVNNAKKRHILHITDVVLPIIGFTESGVHVHEFIDGNQDNVSLSIPFALTVNNNWNITTTFEVEGDYVEQYNQANGTNYALLPDGYTLPLQMVLAKPNKEAWLELNFPVTLLEINKEYMLPIRMKEVSVFEVAADASMYAAVIKLCYPELDRKEWTAEASTEETQKEGDNGFAHCVLDGDPNSFWHSQWDGPGANPPFPHQLIIDTKGIFEFAQIGIIDRIQQKYIKRGKFYVSEDKENWTEVGDFELDGSNDLQKFTIPATTGRYVMIEVLESRDGRTLSALGEVYLYGYSK